MALINLTSGENIFSLDENNIVRVYESGGSVRVEYVDTESLRKTIFVSESMASFATAAKSLMQVTDTVIGVVLINSNFIISVRTEGSGAVIRYDSGDTLRRFSVTETKSEVEALFPTPPVPFVLPYQKYVALLSQSGDGEDGLLGGELVIGKRYEITVYNGVDDFTNVGALVNETGEVFTATGITPEIWGTPEIVGSTLTDTSAPVATILENTIGDIVWSRTVIGEYWGTLTGAFTLNKTFVLCPASTGQGDTNIIDIGNINEIGIATSDLLNDLKDNLLNNTPIEIRIYP